MLADRAWSLVVRAWWYYRRQGAREFVRRARSELRRRHLPLSPVQIPIGVVERDPRGILAAIDAPLADAPESSGVLRISGWASSRGLIAGIDIYVDGRLVATIETGLRRDDVHERMPRLPDSGRSGFATTLSMQGIGLGRHELALAIRDGRRRVRVIGTVFHRTTADTIYDSYYRSTLPTQAEIAAVRASSSNGAGEPRIHLLVDATGGGRLATTVASLRAQDYAAWECTIVRDAPADRGADATAAPLGDGIDRRFRFETRSSGKQLLLDGEADYEGFLKAGESLAPRALSLIAAHLASTGADAAYTDHDTALTDGRHVRPWFVPDWSPDHFLGRNYVGGVFFAGRALLRGVPDHRPDLADPAWRYDLLLRLTDSDGTRVSHIPRVLWSASETTEADTVGYEAEQAAVVDALDRRGAGAEVIATDVPGIRRIRWLPATCPKVSIIIPTTGNLAFLRPCVESIQTKTDYPAFELIFIDNSRGKHPKGIEFLRSHGVRVIERDEPFNWAKLNNDGARTADGELLLFLNDDIEVADPGWLMELASQAVRPDIGAVGALLLYPDGAIQHGGVLLVGRGGGAMHFLQGVRPEDGVYLDLHRVCREVTADTGACLMIKRSLFEEMRGFDEHLAVVGNDIDLCLRLRQSGHRNLWTPFSTLIHHESASRKEVRISLDETRMWDRWRAMLRLGDPYYGPNFAEDRADCSIAWQRIRADHVPPASEVEAHGINLIGYIRAEMGIGEAARGEALAMEAAGIPFAIVDHATGNPARMEDLRWSHRAYQRPVYGVNLLHVNADHTAAVVRRLPPELMAGRYTIGYWVWELPEFPDEWVPAFDFVQEVWVPSTFVLEAIGRKSPVPVTRIPHVIRTPEGPFHDRAHFGLPDDGYQFLTMYDVHSVEARKNPRGAIQAFMDAFPAGDRDVRLVVKVNNSDGRDTSGLRALSRGRDNVVFLDRVMSRDEVDSLQSVSDCFVSLHRSEGFGLAIAEAMALGKPAIVTHWSGNVDFTDQTNAACVDFRLVALERDQGPYRAGQLWAEPDLAQASSWMRRLRDRPELGIELGARGRETIARLLSPTVVGRAIKERLDIIERSAEEGPTPPRPSLTPVH